MRRSTSGPGFHHVALRARDFEATLRFYADAFGFERAYGWGQDAGRAALLATGDGNYVEVFAGGSRPPGEDPPEGALLHYAIRVPDADAAFQRALAAGARAVSAPRSLTIQGDTPVPVRIAFVRGLDGEVIELFQNEAL